MKTFTTSLIFAIFLVGVCMAQDPGERDTVIVETVYVAEGDTLAEVNVFFACDDSIAHYNLPLTWSTLCEPSSIDLSEVIYHNTLISWDDCFDTLVCDPGLTRLIGWYDLGGPDNPPLFTLIDNRELCMTLRFSIDPSASPQVVVIDTTYDYLLGSLNIGLTGGAVEFAPVIIPGAIFYGVTSETDEDGPALPTEISLSQNYPNPFNPSTTLDYSLPAASEVSIIIFNVLGQNVATLVNGTRSAGEHKVVWDAAGFPSGVYFARLEAGDVSRSVRMLLLK